MEDSEHTSWLSACEAIDLVISHNSINGAGAAICKRAHVGLVGSRAVLFRKPVAQDFGRIKVKDFPNVSLPKLFWKHIVQGDSDWSAGDFIAWMDSGAHWEAFGVEFEAAGISAMLGISRSSPSLSPPSHRMEADEHASPPMPSDDEIAAKMLELYELGVCCDNAAILIRQLVGFQSVGNDHARRVATGTLPKGRRRKGASVAPDSRTCFYCRALISV